MNNTKAEPYQLENWALVCRPSPEENPYLAPEQRSARLTGLCFGNPRFMQGELITTSRLIAAPSDDIVQTMNSFYRLGKPDPAYEKLLPNAKQQIIELLRKQCQS